MSNRIKISLSLLALVFLFSLWTGYRGIDFGHHWDEDELNALVNNSVQTKCLLPQWYTRPSLSFYMAYLGILPVYYDVSIRQGKSEKFADYLMLDIGKGTFRLRVRAIYLVTALLTVIWTYLISHMLRKNHFEALLSAAIIGFSYEFAYHARWIAPDSLMMQFAALTIFFVVVAMHKANPDLWLKVAALAGGLTTGSKYPGGIVIVPIILSVFYFKKGDIKAKTITISLLILIFVLGFLISTPGALFEFQKFVSDVRYELNHYKSGHWGYAVSPYLQHGWLLLKYIVLAFFSHYPAISALFFALAIVGAGSMIKSEKYTAIVFLSVPALYFLYFSTQKVMIVRNMMIMAPFLSVLSARGGFYIIDMFKNSKLRYVSACFIIFLLFLNAFWLFRASESIGRFSLISCADEVTDYIKTSKKSIFLSESITGSGIIRGLSDNFHIASGINGADEYLFHTSDIDWRKLLANRYGMYRVVCGSHEVNFDYYPTWQGESRIVSVPVSEFLKMETLEFGPQPALHRKWLNE